MLALTAVATVSASSTVPAVVNVTVTPALNAVDPLMLSLIIKLPAPAENVPEATTPETILVSPAAVLL